MHDSNYYNPVKIISGLNKLQKIKDYLPEGRSLIITDRVFTVNGEAQKLSGLLKSHDTIIFDGVHANPEVDDIDAAVDSFRSSGIENVIALGGGSVIDFAKAAAVFLKDRENRSLNQCLREESAKPPAEKLFLMAIPTTSGTGSEVTPFATVWDSVKQKKYSLAGDMVFPSAALLDPSLTIGLPAEGTLFTGLDAVSHSLESLWNKNCSPVSEAYAMQSLRLALKALPEVIENPGSIEARAEMQWASTLAGFAISQTRTAIAHSISYPLTLKFGVPHGLACGFTLEKLIEIYFHGEDNKKYILNILTDIKALLGQLNLKEKTARYASPDQIKNLVADMYNPARADNYIYKADEGFLLNVLNNSL